MKKLRVRSLTLLFCHLSACSYVRAAPQDVSALKAKMDNARLKHEIRRSSLPAYVLAGSITVRLKSGASSQGKFQLVVIPGGKWKEEVILPGYSRTRIGDGKQFVESDAPHAAVPVIHELDSMLNFTKQLGQAEGDSFKSAKASKGADKPEDCVKRTAKNGTEDTFCFDAQTGDLLGRSIHLRGGESGIWQADSEEFGDYQSWSGKRFPRSLRAFKSKQPYVEVKLDEIKPVGQIPEHFFDVPPGAVVWGDCDERSVWTLDHREQPHYPEAARHAGQQGTVTMYAVIEPDGTISTLQVVSSAGKNLDDASLAAVSKWRYKPIGCSGAPGRTDTFIDVVYSLQY